MSAKNAINAKKVKVHGQSGKLYTGYVRKGETTAQAKARILTDADDMAAGSLMLVRNARIRSENRAKSRAARVPSDNSTGLARRAALRAANRAKADESE